MPKEEIIQRIKYAIGFTAAIAILYCLGGCSGEKIAVRQTNHALVYYPNVVAKIARQAYPCYVINTVNKIDSTEYKKWKDSVYILNAFYTSLFNSIEPVIIHDTTNICDNYKDNEVKFRKQIDVQKKLIAELNNKIDDIPDIKDSSIKWYEDSAKIKIMQVVIDYSNIAIVKKDYQILLDKETIHKKNIWLFYLWLANGLIIAGFILKLIYKLKTP